MSRTNRASRIHAVALLLLALPALALAAVPNRIGYQAVLRDSGGQPLNGSRTMGFALYSAATSGDQILIDEQTVLTTDGVMSVALGAGTVSDGSGPGAYTTLTAVFRDYGDVWMEVRVSGETLSPRIRVPSKAYALNSDTLDGLNYADFLRSDTADSFTASSLVIDSASALDVNGSLLLDGSLEMKTKGFDEDQEIWFYDNGQRGNEKLRWADSLDRFEFSDDTYTISRISNGSSAYVEGNVYFNENGGNASRYLYFYDNGSSTGRSIRYDMTGPAFRFSADLGVAGFPRIHEDLYLGAGGPAADRQIYFYDGGLATGQSISWLNADQKFEFSTDFHTAGSILADSIYLDGGWLGEFPVVTFRGSPNSGALKWDTTGMLSFYEYHFTVDGDLHTHGSLMVTCNPVPYSCFGFDAADEWQIAGINDVFIYNHLEVKNNIFPTRFHGGANSTLDFEADLNVRSMFDDDFTATTTRAEWFHDGVYTSPYKLMELQEDGDLQIRGTLSQNVAFDAAEMFLASESLQPGDVVALDPDRPGAVRKSWGPDDSGILGVVSEAPGFVLGSAPFDAESLRGVWGAEVAERFALEAEPLRAAAVMADPDLRATLETSLMDGKLVGEKLERRQQLRRQAEHQLETVAIEKFFEKHHVAVALAGRVPVAVDTSGGAIQPGDSLVPSAVPGFAEKGDEDGIVIGIALEPFSGGQGRVLALVFPPTRGAGALSEIAAADRAEDDATSPGATTDAPAAPAAFLSANTQVATVFPAAEPLSAGDVVAFDPAAPGALRPARCGDDGAQPLAVGIVADEPGILLGSGLGRIAEHSPELAALLDEARARGDRDEERRIWGEMEKRFDAVHARVGTAGTIPCKVDASFGAVRAGDLLVASPTTGHAMRTDDPAPGTVLAKALEPLDAGMGTIRVLVWGR